MTVCKLGTVRGSGSGGRLENRLVGCGPGGGRPGGTSVVSMVGSEKAWRLRSA